MTPTFDLARRFERDWQRLSPEEQRQFRVAVEKFASDLVGGSFRKGLRVKGVQGAPGVFEMTWAQNGRATFEFGNPVHSNEPHVAWRRIGTHDIFAQP